MATPSELESLVGSTLRRWRIESDLSQEELAARANLSRSAIQGLEGGTGTRLATLIRVLIALQRTDALGQLAAKAEPSPMELLAAKEQAPSASNRRRVSRSRR